MIDEDDISYDDWDISMPLIGDNGDNAGFRIKNVDGETERVNITGYDRNPRGAAVLGRLYHVVNGYKRDGRGSAATLIVFEWLLRPGHVGKRFHEVQIDVVFAASGLRPGMLPRDDLKYYDPGVISVGPTVPLTSSATVYVVEQRTGIKLGLNVGIIGSTINPELSHERVESNIQRVDYSVQEGYPVYVNKNRGLTDGVHWTFMENSKQQSGLPRLIRTAVLLDRRENDLGAFECNFKTTAYISVFESLAENLRRAVGRVPWDDPVMINPAPSVDMNHGAAVLFGSKDVSHLKSPFNKDNLGAEDLDSLIIIDAK